MGFVRLRPGQSQQLALPLVPLGENVFAENLRREWAATDPAMLARWEAIEARALAERGRVIDRLARDEAKR